MEKGNDLRKHLDELNKVMVDLTNMGVKIKEEDQSIILLRSLQKMYKHFVETMLYGKQTLIMYKMKDALNSKELQRKIEMKTGGKRESLMLKGRIQKMSDKNDKNHSISKSRNGKRFY